MANEAEYYVSPLICIYQFAKNGHHCFLVYTGQFGRIRFNAWHSCKQETREMITNYVNESQ